MNAKLFSLFHRRARVNLSSLRKLPSVLFPNAQKRTTLASRQWRTLPVHNLSTSKNLDISIGNIAYKTSWLNQAPLGHISHTVHTIMFNSTLDEGLLTGLVHIPVQFKFEKRHQSYSIPSDGPSS